MATRDFAILQDASTAYDTVAAIHYGEGKSTVKYVGRSGVLSCASFLQFDHDWSGITGVSKVELIGTKSTLHGSWGNQSHWIRANSEYWPTGTTGSDNQWHQNNELTSLRPPGYWANPVVDVATPIGLDGSVFAIDITELARWWAPSGVSFPGGAGQGRNNYGIHMASADPDLSNYHFEFRGQEYGAGAMIMRVTYSTNVAPFAPSWVSPTEGQIVESPGTPVYTVPPTPDLVFDQVDPEGDAITSYDLWVSTDPTFVNITHWNLVNQTAGIAGQRVTRTYAGTAFTRGVYYYARCRTKDAGSGTYGPRSTVSFYINDAGYPVISRPVSAQVAELDYQLGWSQPHVPVSWSTTDPEGDAQGAYEVLLLSDSAGYPGTQLYDSGKLFAANVALTPAYDLTNGNYYWAYVQTWDARGLSRGWVSQRFRARWGCAAYRSAALGTVSAWSANIQQTVGANAKVIIYYGSSNDGTNLLNGWQANLSDLTLGSYLFYWVFLNAWGASPVSPSLDKLTLAYTSSERVPDGWAGAVGVIDESAYYYGTRSLKIAGNGTLRRGYQTVVLKENTPYSLSARIKSLGNSGARMRLTDTSGNVISTAGHDVETPSIAVTRQFEEGVLVYQSYHTPAGAGDTQYQIDCVVTGAAGTAAWFDALQCEASEVVTPWKPSAIGVACVVDAAGVQVDAHAGGVLRLRGTDGGADDVVELGGVGLKIGRALEMKDQSATPSSPVAGYRRLFMRSSDGHLCAVDSAGAVVDLSAGGGSHPDLATHDAMGLATDDALANHGHSGYQLTSARDVANGYAPLDGAAQVPYKDLPVGSGAAQVAQGSHGPHYSLGTTAGTAAAGDHGHTGGGLNYRTGYGSASIAATTSADIQITWPTAFADANYVVAATVGISSTTNRTPGGSYVRLETKTAAGVKVRCYNPAAVALTMWVEAIAIHD